MERKYKIFRWTFSFLFIIFLTLYFSQLTGYYEFKNHQKMEMTKEMIEKFEEDIKAGKEVDIKNYVVNTNKDYKNRFSDIGVKLSTGISDVVKKGVFKIFGTISGFVTDS